MNRKEELRTLISTIRNARNCTQQEVSVGAGYEPNSLSQALSKKAGHGPVIEKLRLVYRDILENPTSPNHVKMNIQSGIDPKEYILVLKAQIDLLKEKAEKNYKEPNYDEVIKTLKELQSDVRDLQRKLSSDQTEETFVYPSSKGKKNKQV